jgi:multiple antibiotic resistance protein
MFELFLKAFVSFLVTANPIGVAAVFVSLMAYADPPEIKRTALRSVLIALGVLLAFAFFGEAILEKFGISIAAFRVSGGILLFSIASKMLFGEHMPEAQTANQRALLEKEDIAVFPLGIPLIAGPGCITLSIIMMAKTETNIESAILVAAILIVMFLTWLCLRFARKVQLALGVSGMNLVTRVMGILLAARSVQIIAEGIQGLNFNFSP